MDVIRACIRGVALFIVAYELRFELLILKLCWRDKILSSSLHLLMPFHILLARAKDQMKTTASSCTTDFHRPTDPLSIEAVRRNGVIVNLAGVRVTFEWALDRIEPYVLMCRLTASSKHGCVGIRPRWGTTCLRNGRSLVRDRGTALLQRVTAAMMAGITRNRFQEGVTFAGYWWQ